MSIWRSSRGISLSFGRQPIHLLGIANDWHWLALFVSNQWWNEHITIISIKHNIDTDHSHDFIASSSRPTWASSWWGWYSSSCRHCSMPPVCCWTINHILDDEAACCRDQLLIQFRGCACVRQKGHHEDQKIRAALRRCSYSNPAKKPV